MRIERIGIKVNDLRFDARDELYLLIDKHYKIMAKNSDGHYQSLSARVATQVTEMTSKFLNLSSRIC